MEPLTGVHRKIFDDETRMILIEGALSSAKTTTALLKEIHWSRFHPGIDNWICRYSQTDTETKLQPAFEKLLSELPESVTPAWNKKNNSYDWPNGSHTFCFGIRANDLQSRYRKLRGVGVARILMDQGEETMQDIFLELNARLRQPGFAHQLTLTANPSPFSHWLCKEFPEKNIKPGRVLYQLSIYDNPWLPKETIDGLESAYPIGHGKRPAAVLGRRGANVMGDPIYESMFNADRHVTRLEPRDKSTIYEAFDVGQHNCAWVAAQRGYAGGLQFLGGIIGQELFLDDFLPIVRAYRDAWFPKADFRTCCGPSGAADLGRYTTFDILKNWLGKAPSWRSNSHAADVRGALIETIGAYMRRRAITGNEMLLVNSQPDRWLRVAKDGAEECPFIAEAFNSGYTWGEHLVSVGHRLVRQPMDDGWAEHGMRCAEWIELNFGIGVKTDHERERDDQAKSEIQPWRPRSAWT